MKRIILISFSILLLIFLAVFYFYIYDTPITEATDYQITGGSWSSNCTGDVNTVHDGNTATGVSCNGVQEINWDFGGTYGDIFRVRIYTSNGDSINSFYTQCWYPLGAGLTCAGAGYAGWNIIAPAFIGPLDFGWNNDDIVPRTSSKFKFINSSSFGMPFLNIEEIEIYYTGSGPTTTPPPTPTPTPSGETPTPSGITPTPSISMSGSPPPIDCPNPPCFDNPDDPIDNPTPDYNIKLLVPNGGEKWHIGQKYKITWEYKDKDNKIKKLALFLSKDGGKNYREVIAQNLPLSTEYEWTIPNNESYVTDEAKVLVGAYGDSIDRPLLSDASDNNFSIISDQTHGHFPWTWIALVLLALSALASSWPAILNFMLNSWITTLLNKLPFLTAPTMGNKKGTGIVYDSYTKSPIAKALVRIFNADNHKQLESVITNKKGEFSFILSSGKYYLKVNSTTHNFPSQDLAKLKNTGHHNQFVPGTSDSGYDNIYFGEVIDVNKGDNDTKRYNLNINIPLDKASAFNVEEKVVHLLRVIENILAFIKWPSIIIGTALSIYSIWSDYSILAVAVLALYIILIIYEVYLLLAKPRPFGVVKDENNKDVDLAVIRFNNQKGKIKGTAISGRDGKFAVKVNPGDYELISKKVGFKEDRRKISIKSIRHLERLDILLKK